MARVRKLRWVLVFLMMVMGVENVSAESKVQEVVSPKGIKAWLIESHTLPMVSIEVNFRGGSEFEPKGKEGLAHLSSSLFDEGAGQYDAKQFKEELEAIGARFGGSADTQDINVNLTTLTEHAPRAFELLGLAVNEPRIDADALARMKDSMLADIRQGDEDPSTVAWRLFRPAIFGNHPYANSGEGTLQSVAALKADDVKAWLKANMTRANMVVSVVGDVTPAQLGALLDEALAGIPQGDHRNEIAKGPELTVPGVTHKKMEVPQGTVLMGHLGLPRTDPDYYPMLVMNEILGGGVLTSRLGADVREKHGLVYDVRSVNNPLPFNGMFYVSLATDNSKVEQALELVRKHLNLIRDEKVPEGEFDDAKAYLVGSFPLRADSNGKLLQMLAMMQSEGLGTDYMQQWPKKIAAVTVADVQRAAQRLIQPNGMALVVVGDGPALEAK